MSSAVLLPSPLLPARAYAPLVDALRRRGWGVAVAAVPEAPAAPEPVAAAFRAAVTAHGADLVLAHSNAGRYAVAAAGDVPVVHVDAALPPEHGDATLAPEGLLDHLAGMADDDGLLPPWTRWWPDDDIATVVPDAQVLADIRADEQRMPLAYFRSRLGAPEGWQDHPQAYLALGQHLRRGDRPRAAARLAHDGARRRPAPAPPRRPGCRGRRAARPCGTPPRALSRHAPSLGRAPLPS